MERWKVEPVHQFGEAELEKRVGFYNSDPVELWDACEYVDIVKR